MRGTEDDLYANQHAHTHTHIHARRNFLSGCRIWVTRKMSIMKCHKL